jgi:hypothetical protein
VAAFGHEPSVTVAATSTAKRSFLSRVADCLCCEAQFSQPDLHFAIKSKMYLDLTGFGRKLYRVSYFLVVSGAVLGFFVIVPVAPHSRDRSKVA